MTEKVDHEGVDVLAWIGERIAAHEALSADAFHAQELPKAEAVRAAVAELIAAAKSVSELEDEPRFIYGAIKDLRAALSRMEPHP